MKIVPKTGLALILITIIWTTLLVNAIQPPKSLVKPVNYPLPTQPEPVLVGTTFKMVIEADADASNWKMRVIDDKSTAWTHFLNSTFEGKLWTIYFKLPIDLKPSLYDVNVAYSTAGKNVNYTQVRSAWVLNTWPSSLTIAQITDLHMPYGADNVAKFVYEANFLRPDMIISTGDNVDTETIASGWGYLQTLLNRLDIPSFVGPGNHDYAGAKSQFYQLYGGRLNYTVTLGKFLLIALDSGANGYLNMEDMQWASNILAKNPNKIKVLFFHHPLLSRDISTHNVEDKGGDITGDWTKAKELVSLMHLGWCNLVNGTYVPKPEAVEFLKMVQTYDVRLILNGHVHTDVIHLLNDKNWFVTTAAIGGGVTTPQYNGYRIIKIDDTGNVTFDPIKQATIYNAPNSIPVGNIKYFFKNNNDGTDTAVTAVVVNNLDLPLTNGCLVFHVNSTKQISDYKFQGLQPKKIESSTSGSSHTIKAYIDINAKSTLSFTLSAEPDSSKPNISITPPDHPYNKGKSVNFTVDSSDSGWGLKNISISYKFEMDSQYNSLEAPFTLKLDKENNILSYPSESYQIQIPDTKGYELRVKVEATDFANNTEKKEITIKANPPPPPEKKFYSLTIESDPSSIKILLDNQSKITPFTITLEEGKYMIIASETVQSEGNTYIFSKWNDGSTEKNRDLTLSADTKLTLFYTKQQPPPPQEPPKSGIPIPISFTLAGMSVATIILIMLRKKATH